MSGIFEELGVRPVLNAQGNRTLLGGSTPSASVRALMEEAEEYYVDMGDLMDSVGQRIAGMLGVEAALVTSGCSAALAVGAAACMTGSDPAMIDRIPDITGTYAGSGMFTLSNCQDDFLNDTFSGVSLTISITSQTGGQFTGSQSLRLNVLGVTYTEEGTISGTITSDGSVSGTGSSDGFIDGDFDSSSEGTFTGSVAGTTLVFESRSQDTVGDTCLSTSSFTLQRQ